MSKKGLKVEDMIDLVQDERIMAVLITNLATALEPVMEKLFDKFAAKFKSELNGIVEILTKNFVDSHCEPLKQKISALELENEQLQARMDDIENNQKSDNLMIHGLPETKKEDNWTGEFLAAPSTSCIPSQSQQSSVQSVVNFCNTSLHLNLSESNISYAHRIPQKGKDKNRPLIVRFVNRDVRNVVFASRRILRDAPKSKDSIIYINEHLTKLNSQIFARAKNLIKEKKAVSAWTAGGKVFLRQSTLQSERPKKILSMKDLEEL